MLLEFLQDMGDTPLQSLAFVFPRPSISTSSELGLWVWQLLLAAARFATSCWASIRFG